jgi:serine/threonine protein kinase
VAAHLQVAIKKIEKKRVDPSAFQNEIDIMNQLKDHPNICTFYDGFPLSLLSFCFFCFVVSNQSLAAAFEDDRWYYVVMDLADGELYDHLCARNYLSEKVPLSSFFSIPFSFRSHFLFCFGSHRKLRIIFVDC